ncbi:MAG: hypothetical protein PHX25_00095 [Candidatus Pacebacteria bacterium]|nr:hypothetical protein [Candidatus Paceibacterota bacterium]
MQAEVKVRETGRTSYAGFGIILQKNNKKGIDILIVMEDPSKKEGGSRWENFFVKFPGGSIDSSDDIQKNSRLSGIKILSEVCGISFERLSDIPFFTAESESEDGKHLANFYLAKLEEGDPRPCKTLKFAEMVSEDVLRILLKKNRLLKKHGQALEFLFFCLDRIRLDLSTPEEAKPLEDFLKN